MDLAELQLIVDEVVKPLFNDASAVIFNATLVLATFLSVLFLFIAFEGLFSDGRQRTKKGTFRPFVTVQIPTYNEPVALRCAVACLKLDYPKDRVEILIGDDSTDQQVSGMITAFARKHAGKVRVIRRKTNAGYKAGNLNNLLRHSKGEVVVVFDSDFVPARDFLKKAVQPFADEKIACVQSRWDFINADQNLVSKLASTILIVYHHLTMPLVNRYGMSFICGSAEAVRKSVLLELGGWQNGSLTEDTEFSLRVMQSGYRSVYLADLKTKGEVPFTFRGFKRQQMRWAYGTTKAFMDHAGMLVSGKFSFTQKFYLAFILLGYVSAPVLALLFISGTVNFITTPAAPIDVAKFLSSLGKNMLLTSGFIVASTVALAKSRRLHMFLPAFLSSLTVGIIVSFSIANAFFKAVLKRPMEWYMIQKQGNETARLHRDLA
ncbi:MAG: glycosyltransferase [Candidatus Aenigmarchaeota archaeon]|nr:glycosyltransferase [Candidatus Aenigmarchaeota archaeon]